MNRKLLLKSFLLLVVCLSAWNFWLSPLNGSSPLIKSIYYADQATVFREGYFGQVYVLQLGQGIFTSSKNIKLEGVNVSDFELLNPVWAKTDSEVYNAYEIIRGGPSFQHLDALSFQMVDERNLECVRDKYHAYCGFRAKVWDLRDPLEFRILESAEDMPDCWSNGKYICGWYQSDTNVFWWNRKYKGLDLENFKLLDRITGTDGKNILDMRVQWIDPSCDSYKSCKLRNTAPDVTD